MLKFLLSIYDSSESIGFVNGKSIFFIEILNESTFRQIESTFCRPESKFVSITSIRTAQTVLLPFWA
jgi:hypothetical protein